MLHEAIISKNHELVKVCLEKGMKLENSSMFHAVISNNIETCKLLISAGSDLQILNNAKQSVLFYVKSPVIMDVILPHIHNLQQKDKNELTAQEYFRSKCKLQLKPDQFSAFFDPNYMDNFKKETKKMLQFINQISTESNIRILKTIMPFELARYLSEFIRLTNI